EYRHLRHHSDLAEEVGIPKENIFILENGDVIEFTPDGDVVKSCINAGVIYVDGLGVGDIEDFVIRDRQRLAQDGIILVVLGVSKRSGEITSGPDLISKGFIFPEEDDNLLDDVKFRIIKKIKNKSKNIEYDWAVLKKEIKNVATHYIYQKVRRRPMIIPIIVEM
ncbi:MAG: ribonuclease J, partial [Actinomycetia bacterium]|nr:ribonuclease J [Actinomycetes bacterium]